MKPGLLLLFLALTASAEQYRAFWADAFHPGYKSPSEVDQMIDDLVKAQANAVIVEVRSRGGSYFTDSIEPPAEDSAYSPTFDALRYVIEKAHAKGIEVHAWYPVTPLWPLANAPKDPKHAWNLHGPAAKGDAMWMTMTASGKISGSVDPGHPDVLKYLADVILTPATKYDLDGLHLDYIRYPEDDNYGWNPKAVERFNRLNNRTGIPSASDPLWAQFRRDQVTALVRQVYLRAYEIRPSIRISGALITWGDGPVAGPEGFASGDAQYRMKDAYSRVFQDWRGWLEEGILDLGMPMNYFREGSNASFLNHWIEFEKDRQYRRGLVIGTASYLNSIPESLAQFSRTQAPSASGNRPLGAIFYSYASTNILNDAGLPTTPNSEFYQALASTFGGAAAVPSLPWKANPERGHILGTVTVDNGPAWLADGVNVLIESDTGRSQAVRTATDGTGFFGAVDLPPDRYRVRLERAGVELFRTVAKDLAPGAAIRFDVFLHAGDFSAIVPSISTVARLSAAPGDYPVTIIGKGFGPTSATATSVPLPTELAGTQVLVNGVAAALLQIASDRIAFQMPFQKASQWQIVVRRAGMESAPYALKYEDASPAFYGARYVEGGNLEIYLTGCGAVTPVPVVGDGGSPVEPYNRMTQPVKAALLTKFSDTPLQVLYAGLAPFQPFLYQVNVALPPGISGGSIQLQIGASTPMIFNFP